MQDYLPLLALITLAMPNDVIPFCDLISDQYHSWPHSKGSLLYLLNIASVFFDAALTITIAMLMQQLHVNKELLTHFYY